MGRSAIMQSMTGGVTVSMAPNVRRDRVSFTGSLRQPLRFREAISALHDVVISDLRFKPKDKTAYQAHLVEQRKREERIRRAVTEQANQQLLAHWTAERRKELDERYQRMQKLYWDARTKYSDFLQQHDPELWRLLVPMDPVITVAPDILFFECFSADESSYGCLTVDRNAFTAEKEVSLGTTNVDYSWALYEHFQELRSYRQTRFTVDPGGFEVKHQQGASLREEKIDLPTSWLRGFMQLQAAMSLPMRRVPISREGLYNVLVWLKRHKARRSPRAVRFELEPGKPVAIVLEPWDKRFTLHSTPYLGPKAEVIRTWGRDRLRVLARLLPLLDDAEVFLLGTGLPSYWSVRMGEMRLILGLSGWTVNDWTGASALDQIMPPAEATPALIERIKSAFQSKSALKFKELLERTEANPPMVLAGVNRLAGLGQLIHDLPAGLYRWRQIMPVEVSKDQLGPENPETVAARRLVSKVKLTRDDRSPTGLRLLAGSVENRNVELVIDNDGRMIKGKCTCSHHFTGGLRRGPCRHVQALRTAALSGTAQPATLERWFDSFLS
jgi:hypothetical protein